MARILWRDAQGKEGSIELDTGEALIGRALNCAIRTDDAMVSRNHARIFWQGNECYVEDLGSANGVFYQERRVTRHTLKHGDAVRCGSLWFRFVESKQRKSESQAYQAQPQQPQQAYSQQAPPPQRESGGHAQAPAPSNGASGEVRSLRRRVEQLQSELRMMRNSANMPGGRMEELEKDMHQLGEENEKLKYEIQDLTSQLQNEGQAASTRRAQEITEKASETVAQLNDLLSNMRINMTAAEGEFEQFNDHIPRASFELIRESLRSSAQDVENARDLVRDLRSVTG